MKNAFFFVALSLCIASCNTLYVSRGRTAASVPKLGLEWPTGYTEDDLQPRVDSVINAAMDKWNTEKHSFTVYRRQIKDKAKDYVTIDFRRIRVVGTGGKIAGYVLTPIGLALPVFMIIKQAPLIVFFFYLPEHSIESEVTLSATLSDDRRNRRGLVASAGALFAPTKSKVNKMLGKYGKAVGQLLHDIEMQLQANK